MSELTMDRLRENLESLKMKNTLEILDNYLERAVADKLNIVEVLDHIFAEEAKSKRKRGVCPKICVNTIIGANRAILIQGGSRGIRLPSCLQHNAGGAGCQGRRSRLITLDIRARRCYSGMRSAK